VGIIVTLTRFFGLDRQQEIDFRLADVTREIAKGSF